MHDFFSQINYSASNEDGQSEIRGLDIQSDDTILCITGSGSRSLDLLIARPKKVISIDFNPAQNFLLELKIAGYRYLCYADFLILMGIHQRSQSQQIFEQIAHHLSHETREFFLKNQHLFKKGLIYSGTWEQINAGFSRLLFWKKKEIQKLFASYSLTEQHQIWKKTFGGKWFRLMLQLISSRWIWQYIIREPGSKLIPREMDVGQYMHERLNHLERQGLLRENDFANLIFLGSYHHTLPLHLREQYFDIIKDRLDSIEIRTISLIEALEDAQLISQVTALSLSDFGSYMPEENYDRLWDSIIRDCSGGTKFVERQYLIKRPQRLSPYIRYDDAMESILSTKDASFIYSFRVGSIVKN